MTKDTAIKRIEKALKECKFIDTEEKKTKALNLIYSDYLEFKNEEPDYSDTKNLNFAIAIWCEDDGGIHLDDYVNGR